MPPTPDADPDPCVDGTFSLAARAWAGEVLDHEATLGFSPPSGDSTTPAGTAATRPHGDGPPGYEIQDELGRGGMGVVYKALHLALNRPVALKMVRSGARASAVELLRFKAEGETVARLNHPNVVQVHEVGVHAGSPYLVLEYCDGGNLDEKLAGAPLPHRQAATLVATLARAVHAAHVAGIVHRDLKPANVLLTADGTPKVADFGLAKWVEAGDGMTVTGAVLGTPSYMAPEQASGDTKAIDRRADVYALGAILYACLTGRPPFKGATALDTLDHVRRHEPASVRSLQPGTPRDLETVCLKCLQKAIGKRYPSAAALADDLDRYLAGNSVLARPVGSRERAWRWCRRNPAVAALLVGVLAVSLAGTAASLWSASVADERRAEAVREKLEADEARLVAQSERSAADGARLTAVSEKAAADKARQSAQEATAAAEDSRGKALAAKRRAEWSAYTSQVSLCQREWELGNAPAAFQILGATNSELRGWEYTYLERLFLRDRLWTKTHVSRGATLGIDNLAVSPKGDRLATTDREGLTIWDAKDGALLRRVSALTQDLQCLTYSPDGNSLLAGDGKAVRGNSVISSPGRIRAWDAQTGKLRFELPKLPGTVKGIHFHPSQNRILVACGDGVIYWLEYPSGAILRSVQTDHGQYLRVALSAEGQLLASAGLRGDITIHDEADGSVTAKYTPATEKAQGRENHADLAFSPDTKMLSSTRNGLHVWEVPSGRVLSSSTDSAATITRSVWTADSSSLLSASEDRTISVWEPRSGRRTTRLSGHLNGVYGLGVSEATAFSGSYDGKVVAWRLDQPPEPLELRTSHQGWFYDLKMANDATGLFSSEGGSANVARHWNLATGRLHQTYSGHAEHVTTLAASRNDKVLFSGSKDATARMWDVETGACRSVFRGHSGAVVGVACPPDAGWLATAGADGEVRLWNPASGTLTQTLIARAVGASRLTCDPEGRLLVASFLDGAIVAWETATWRETGRYPHGALAGGEVYQAIALALSPDGKRLVSAGTDRSLRAWDLQTGTPLWAKAHDDLAAPVLSIAFLPGGRQFVTGGGAWGAPGEVKVWDAATGENTFTLRGISREIYGVAVNPADGSVAACSHEGAIKVFGLPTAQAAGRASRQRADSAFERGQAHRKAGELDKAVAAYRAAIDIDPTSADYHLELADALGHKPDPDGALAATRIAIRLEPESAKAYAFLGYLLRARDDWAGAAEAYRAVARLEPDSARGHYYLGETLVSQGKLADAAEALQAALKLAPTSLPIRRRLTQMNRWIQFDARVPKLLDGTDAPKSFAEALEIADFCAKPFRKNYDLAVKLYRHAFGCDPELRARPSAAHDAACAAILLAAGTDPTVTLGDDEWHFLHATARSWLAAELAAQVASTLDATPAERQAIRRRLASALTDRDLRAARDPAALAAMPADERAAWEGYWKELAAAIESTGPVPAAKVPAAE